MSEQARAGDRPSGGEYAFLDLEAADVMSQPVTIGPDDTLAHAERVLEEFGFNGLPVVERDGALVGFVTSLDLLRAFDDDEDTLPPFSRIMERPVASVMRIDPLVVQPRTPLPRVLEKMIRTRNKSFPVVEPHGCRLVGVIAREDLMRALRDPGEPSSGG